MLEDGSPRYGIRTIVADPAIEPAARPQVDVGQIAEAAAELDGAELKIACLHRYVLDRFTQDAATIAGLREAHPQELQLAEEAVAGRLGSPHIWVRGARRAYIETTIDHAEKSGTLHTQLAAMVLSLCLSTGTLAILIGMLVLHVPPLPFLGVSVGLLLIIIPIRKALSRPANRSILPYAIGREEGQMFWDDVVNATLLAMLQNNGVTVNLATAAALTRGWNHTQYVAATAQKLRTAPASTA